jgi:hypothetical protein
MNLQWKMRKRVTSDDGSVTEDLCSDDPNGENDMLVPIRTSNPLNLQSS